MPVSFVTPSTSVATSSPKRSRTSSSDARRVLDGVVQQRRAQRLGVEAHAGADLGHADRVDDEVLARLAPLVGVVLAGEEERVLDARRGRSASPRRRRAPRRSRTGRRAAGARSAVRSARATGACASGCVDAVDRHALGGRVRAVARRRRGGGRRRVGARLGGHPPRVPPASAGAAGVRRGLRPRAERSRSASRRAGRPARVARPSAARGRAARQARGVGAEGRRALELGARGRRQARRRRSRVDADEAELARARAAGGRRARGRAAPVAEQRRRRAALAGAGAQGAVERRERPRGRSVVLETSLARSVAQRLAPRQMGRPAAPADAARPCGVGRRRVERDDVRRSASASAGSRSSASHEHERRSRRGGPRRLRAPARARRRTTTSTGSPRGDERGERRRRSRRRGGRGRHAGRAAAARRPRAERRVELGQRARPPASVGLAGDARSAPARGGRARRRTSRGSTAPFHSLSSRLNVASRRVLAAVGQPAARRRRPRARAARRRPRRVKRTCLPSPIGRASDSRAAGHEQRRPRVAHAERREAARAPRRAPSPSSSPGDDGVDALARARGPPGPAPRPRARRTRRGRRRPRPRAIVQPAAARWPPWRSRCSAHASSPPSRSKAGIERPEPVPSSPSSAISTHGRWWRSAIREATMPMTPGCQSSPAST